MTRAYIARRLFEHGPLTSRQFTEITGWSPDKADDTLQSLHRRRQLIRFASHGSKHYTYRLAA